MSDGRAAPYDVLSRFSESLTGEIEPERQAELPLRMARLLAEGTGARWAQVWLVVDDQPELAAAWPQESAPEQHEPGDDQPGLRSRVVTLDGARLGILRLQEHRDQPLSPVEERLFAGLAAQAGLVLRGARLRAELLRRADDLASLADDLQTSRRRVVDTHDSERRRLERDIHDGAQQHLVALVVNLRLAHTLTARSPDRARTVLAEQVDAVDNAITSLVDLSRGIYPTVLTEDGVAAAVRDVVASSAIPVTVLDARDRQARARSWRRPCTSAASKPCRTPSSTPPPAGSRSGWPSSATGSSCSCATTGTGSTYLPWSPPADWGTCATAWTR